MMIPFVHSVDDLFLVFYVLARLTGLFLVSPLFSNFALNSTTRIGLMVFTAVLISMVIFPDYRGESPRFEQPQVGGDSEFSLLMLILTLGKELIIGYLIGFCFTLLFQALLIAGHIVSVMIGLSISKMFDPVSGTSQSVVSQFFTLTVTLVLISLDLHHVLLRVVSESFSIVPLGQYHLRYEMLQDITHGTARFFHYALRYAAIPYVVLILVTFALGFMAKVMPEMNIFMVGFPLKILIGYYSLLAAVSYFPVIFQQSFTEYFNLAGRVLRHLGGGP